MTGSTFHDVMLLIIHCLPFDPGMPGPFKAVMCFTLFVLFGPFFSIVGS